MSKPRILLFNSYYLPGIKCGGPVTSAKTVVDSCHNEFDFYIVCYNHDLGSSEPYPNISSGWNKVGNANVLYIEDGKYDYSTKNLTELIESVKPQLIWFPGVLLPKEKWCTISIAKKKNIPVLFSPRGEVCADRVKIKAYKKIPFLFFVRTFGIYRNNYFQSTCDDETKGIKRFLGIPSERIYEVTNIPKMISGDIKYYETKPGKLSIAFVSRIHQVKNLLYSLNVVSKISDIDIVYDIYGPIESSEYWEECQKVINQMPSNVKVEYKRTLAPDEVGEVFKEYDCFLFPTINENYGHVIAEALGNGCIAIISKGTTPWDDLESNGGYVCSLDHPEEFERALREVAGLSTEELMNQKKKCIDYYQMKLKQNDAVKGHINMFKDLIAKHS